MGNKNNRGFTLVELLIVIGILALIATALLRNVLGATETANIAATTTLIADLERVATTYSTIKKFGDYPPDDLKDTSGQKLRIRGDGTNAGIESFLIFVNRRNSRTEYLDENHFSNTDEDTAGKTLGKLETNQKYELKDAWGNPLAYFHFRNYNQTQQYMPAGEEGGGEVQTVQAWKNAEGSFFRRGKYQFFSAGPDGEYGTKDDVATFPIPREQ